MDRTFIEEILLHDQIKPSTKGFEYLVSSISLYDGKMQFVKELYEGIAKEFATTSIRIERCMRTAIQSGSSTISDYTVSQYIATVRILAKRKERESMMDAYKNHIIKLFNSGVLTEESQKWYEKQGYKIVRDENDFVVDIIKEEI